TCLDFSYALPLLFPLSFHFSSSHRDLHSFPTRRSSDLFRICREFQHCGYGEPPSQADPASQDLPPWLFAPHSGPFPRIFRRGNRSEEHTSELQSRFDLVCRLLLEKKKKLE